MKITIVRADEWDGLYLDDECVWQHDDLTLWRFFEELKHNGVSKIDVSEVRFISVNDEAYEHLVDVGHLPDSLAELSRPPWNLST